MEKKAEYKKTEDKKREETKNKPPPPDTLGSKTFGMKLLSVIVDVDKDFEEKNGRRMSYSEMRQRF